MTKYLDDKRYPGKSTPREAVTDVKRGSLGIHATPSEVRYAYFIWLMELVGLNGEDHVKFMTRGKENGTYFRLANKLMYTTFRPIVPHDINRATDGINLRTWFAQSHSAFDNYTVLDDPNCSMLEMLIAFAQRIDRDIMQGPDDPDRSIDWFWLMLGNCGLSVYNDEKFMQYDTTNVSIDMVVAELIDNVNSRNYDWRGVGGLFPVKDHKRGDYKTVELWYQMQDFLNENYIDPT